MQNLDKEFSGVPAPPYDVCSESAVRLKLNSLFLLFIVQILKRKLICKLLALDLLANLYQLARIC